MMGIGATELIIIAVVLLVLLAGFAGAAVLVFVLVSRGRAKTTPAGVPSPAPYQPAPIPHQAAVPQPAPAAAAPGVRMLAAPDYDFKKIEVSMRQCDFALEGKPGPDASRGEPSSATFTDGKHRITYRYDARHGLRMIDITGPNAKYVRNDILNIAYMPTLEGYKVSGLLGSSNPAELLRGILAAEFIGVGGDQKYYINPVANLLQHPDGKVRQEAQRVHAVLTSRA